LSLSVSPPDGEVLRNARRKSAIEVKLSLITPMFGGSADAGQVDPHRPVTAKSIRGHLRFWWRACRAGQFRSVDDVDDMFRREAEIWGAAAEFNNKGGLEQGPGAVDLEVEVTNAELIRKASRESGPQERVFMFPFQRPAAEPLRDVSFTLRLFLKSEGFKEDVRDALIAWILFGGVGARTRRGCGALKLEGGLEDYPSDYPSDVNALRNWAGRLPTPPPEPWITCLSGVRAVLGKADSAENAWPSLGTYWSRFRKGHSGGRWPDHEVLKQLRGDEKSLSLVKPFLGLPIVYQPFPGSFVGTVEPEDSGRMASPVILKPLALGNREVRPAVVVLRAPRPGRVKVKKVKGDKFEVTLPLDDPIIEGYGDLFEAVLKSATEHFTDADCIGF